VVPNFDGAPVRLRKRLFDDFLIVSTFGDFDVCKVAMRADGVNAIYDHDTTPELRFQRSLSGAGSGDEISGDVDRALK